MTHQMLLPIPLPDNHPKWFNSPVFNYEGTLNEIIQYIPLFERRPFELTQSNFGKSHQNERLNMIVRMPLDDKEGIIPVGTVSKEYALVQHTDVVKVASDAFKKADIEISNIQTKLEISEYGERMNLSLYLPDEFSFDPGDGHKMAMRLECTNSVDGSTRFRALVGWYRFVCSNGLIIGITKADIRRRHINNLQVDDIGQVLLSGINASREEKDNLILWRNKEIQFDKFYRWVNEDLIKKWGFKAATRTFHIAMNGHDVLIRGPYTDKLPTTIPVHIGSRVPGTPEMSDNLFDLSQILAWLAKERRDLQERLEWKESIPELIKAFLN